MASKRPGLLRIQALLEALQRKIDLNKTTLKHLNVEYFKNNLSDDSGRGEVITFGGGTTVAGKTYYLNSGGNWAAAGVSSAGIGGKGMLAIALGTSPSDGMLLRGFFDVATYLTGGFTAGATVYLAASGQLTTTTPSTSTEILRVVGVCSNTANIVYFNPSADYLVIE